jgi:hypothetical protein
MENVKLEELRNAMIDLRDECATPEEFDADGAIILSHAIRWMSFKLEGKPFSLPAD